MDRLSSPTNLAESTVGGLSFGRPVLMYLSRLYLALSVWVWRHLPVWVRSSRMGIAYGGHVHGIVRLTAARSQYVGTFFLRNRPELELLTRLLEGKCMGAAVEVAVLGCSKGAEVYSLMYAIRRRRPDLQLRLRAVDIAKDMLDLAEAGVYSCDNSEALAGLGGASMVPGSEVEWLTARDQPSSIFERMSGSDMEAMFDRGEGNVSVKPVFREGLTWHLGNAQDPLIVQALGVQDIVVANRFLCHMEPADAEACLRNVARLVKPGGYLFVSGVDLSVRSKVSRELGWRPVTDLIREIHDGDPSLSRGWPLEYWGLEPFQEDRRDSMIRYASVFQVVDTLSRD